MEYVVSFSAYVQQERTVFTPKWWQFWREPIFESHMAWVRYSMYLKKNEGDLLLAEWHAGQDIRVGPIMSMLCRALAGADTDNTQKFQIETIVGQTNYIPSEYVSTEE